MSGRSSPVGANGAIDPIDPIDPSDPSGQDVSAAKGRAARSRPGIFGIVNVTRDSFSDGGRYLDADAAIEQALALRDAGAAVIDVGACSSHPDSEQVSAAEEIRRLTPVIGRLRAVDVALSVDSHNPAVQIWAMEQGVAFLNDIHGFADKSLYPNLARYSGRLVVMHSVQKSGPADRSEVPAAGILERVVAFFQERIQDLVRAGISRSRLILDPGLGFFVGTDPEVSLSILRGLPRLKEAFGLPVFISASRKSFLGTLTGRAVPERAAATLAAELFAAGQGADYIRTHDVGALRDALTVWRCLSGSETAQAQER